MATIEIPNVRQESTVLMPTTLKDNGVAVDWSGLQNIKAYMYSDAQRVIAGKCDVEVDGEDATVLKVTYAATRPQYLGVNSLLVRCKYHGREKSYDVPVLNFVERTAQATGVTVLDDPVIDVEIEVDEVSTSLLDGAIAAALDAAVKAEEAAALVPLQVLEDCVEATENAETATAAANEAAAAASAAGITSVQASVADNEPGTPSVDAALLNKVLSLVFHHLKGAKGDTGATPNISVGTVTTGAPGTPAVITMTGTAEAPVLNITIPQGLKGIPGVANAKYKQVAALPTASAATMDFIYLVESATAGIYNMSYTEEDAGAYSWKSLGTTAIQLADFANKQEVSQLSQEIGDMSGNYHDGYVDVEFTPTTGYYYQFNTLTPTEGSLYEYAVINVQPGEKFYIKGWNLNANIPLAFVLNSSTNAKARVSYQSTAAAMETEYIIPDGYDRLYVNGRTAVSPVVIKRWEQTLDSLAELVDKRLENVESTLDGAYLRQTCESKNEDKVSYVPLPEFEYSRNLINKEDKDVLIGYRIISDTPEPNANYNATGYIPVIPGETYRFSPGTFAYIAVYDKTRKFLRYLPQNDTFVAGEADAYVRLSMRDSNWREGPQFERGITITEFVPYGVKFKCPAENMPQISMPAKVYIFEGIENSIYHKNYLDWITDDFILSSYRNYPATTWKYLNRCFRTTNAQQTIEMMLWRVAPLTLLKRVAVETVVGAADTDNGNVNVLCIGDSFTYDGRYIKQIADLCPNITTIGMRRPAQSIASLQRCEGRGGWKLSDYASPLPQSFDSFSPFVQAPGYNYYGITTFWKAVKGTSPDTYRTGGFDGSGFDSDGYKINPSVNDLMYDGEKYVAWNGSSWSEISSELTFGFDFSKYLSIWGVSNPDFVFIFLGKNDFHGGVTGWADFKSNLDSLIASIHDYNPSIIIGVCTPTTADEAPNNSDNTNARLAHFNMWNARKLLIDNYDNLEDSNVFIVDTGTTLDPDYGFVFDENLPFSFYEGDERELYAHNGVHPSGAGYKQLGTCMAGFIQAKR